MRLSKEEKKAMFKAAKSRKVRQSALAVEKAQAKLPKMTPLQYIRWLDEYQRVFGQFPVSRHKIKVKKGQILL